MTIDDLEQAAREDGYKISRDGTGYYIRLRGSVGRGATLAEAIASAIRGDREQEEFLDSIYDPKEQP